MRTPTKAPTLERAAKVIAQSTVVEPTQLIDGTNFRIAKGWEPTIDKVEKFVSLSIPLKTGTDHAGFFVIGCDPVHVFFRMAFADTYHLLDRPISTWVDFSYPILNERFEGFRGVIGIKKVFEIAGVGPNYKSEWTNNSDLIRDLVIRRLHHDKNFDVAFGSCREKVHTILDCRKEDEQKNTISVRQMSEPQQSDTKNFDAVAAYCMNSSLE